MIPSLRSTYNQTFSPDRYRHFLKDLHDFAGDKIPFRIAETPVFVPDVLHAKLVSACEAIIDVIVSPGYVAMTGRSVPPSCFVPGDEQKPMWLAFDFAICRDNNWQLEPQLIEMQGFPSLFFYQHLLARSYRKHFVVPENVSHLFSMDETGYEQHMRNLLLNGHDPKHVVLLEVEPEKQNTRIDFLATFRATGIQPVCISKVQREGRKLFYDFDGIKTEIRRIYNRVIFDEFMQRTDLPCQFHLTEEVDVEWAGHPNWFFRVSKFTMPFLKNPFVPETTFLHELKSIPADLENYVLKPLFSFSGSGVEFHVTRENIDRVKDPENWILQRKVKYEPVIEAPGGNVKTEIRMLYSWHPADARPRLIINMARLSKGEMIGVKYNKDLDWVGGSVGFFEK
jgi:hypothetical protein